MQSYAVDLTLHQWNLLHWGAQIENIFTRPLSLARQMARLESVVSRIEPWLNRHRYTWMTIDIGGAIVWAKQCNQLIELVDCCCHNCYIVVSTISIDWVTLVSMWLSEKLCLSLCVVESFNWNIHGIHGIEARENDHHHDDCDNSNGWRY